MLKHIFSNPSTLKFIVEATKGLILALVVYFVQQHFFKSKNQKRLPPGPVGIPILGNLLQIGLEPFKTFDKWGKKYGPIFTVKLGARNCLILNSREVINDIYVKRGSNFSNRLHMSLLSDIFMHGGRGITVTPYGERWKRDRKVAHSALGPKAVKNYQPAVIHEIRVALKELYKTSNKNFDAAPVMRRFTISSVMTILYGKKIKGIDDPWLIDTLNFAEDIAEFSQPTSHIADFLPFMKIFDYIYNPALKKCYKLSATMERLFAGTYREFLEDYHAGKHIDPCFALEIQEDLKKEENNLDFEDVWIILANLLGGAFQTGGDTLLWIQGLLTNNPDVQARLHKELDEVCGDNPPTFEDQPNLPYVSAVINEGLRMRPPNPMGIPHTSMEDDEYNGYFIPKDTPTFMNMKAVHFDPVRYPEPEKFYPERWLPKIAKTHRRNDSGAEVEQGIDHIAFGAGRRYCIGQYMAQALLYAGISNILWAFEIKPIIDANGKPVPVDIDRGIVGLGYSPYPYEVRYIPRKNLAEILKDY